jgi:hypothetical protein
MNRSLHMWPKNLVYFLWIITVYYKDLYIHTLIYHNLISSTLPNRQDSRIDSSIDSINCPLLFPWSTPSYLTSLLAITASRIFEGILHVTIFLLLLVLLHLHLHLEDIPHSATWGRAYLPGRANSHWWILP